MRSFLFFFISVFLFSLPVKIRAQSQSSWDAAKIKQQLEKLSVLGRVLYVGAHPDDENTQLLAYLANEKDYRTAYLSLTRGDGGQNLVGDEQGPYIGLMRTEELLAARRNDGAEQFFSHALDFGYSKTAKETFDFWGHQRILADVVWVVRNFRPDIIICRFPEDKRAGHGNHWASAILAHEAFDAAGDSTQFPNQLQYTITWQPKRILWNTYNFGHTNTTSPDQFKIDVGGFNPLLGKGYGKIAAESRSMHKSQGFGASASYGKHWEYFKNIAGPAPRHSLMDGVNTGWSQVEGGEKVGALIKRANKEYDVDQPEASIPLLLQIRSAIKKSGNSYWEKQKIKAVNQLILACGGIRVQAFTHRPYVVAGQSLEIQVTAINQSRAEVSLASVRVLGKKERFHKKLEKNNLEEKVFETTIPANTPISQPYWLRKPQEKGYYLIPNQQLVGRPQNPPTLTVAFQLDIEGETLTAIRQIDYKYTDPVRGEVHDPLVVAPPVTANISNEVYVFTSADSSQKIEVKLKGFKDQVEGVAHVEESQNFVVQNNDQAFTLEKQGDEKVLHFKVRPKGEISASSTDTFEVALEVGGKTYKRGIKVIAYGYIPTITVFPLAQAKLVAMPLKISNRRIGYIMGAGDKVPGVLTQMGYNVKILKDNEITPQNLRSFDAVIVGIRAYNTRDNLKYVQSELLHYVKEGGTLLIQYNTNRNLVTRHLGPYPFQITRNRVTDETSPVQFLLPDDPVLNEPNKITQSDFNGWIQERGLYFVDQVDTHYRQPLAMHDEDEAPLDGSLIVCNYGKGRYVYTGLVFFRQLPAGVPGAFRLFANLIGSSKHATSEKPKR